MRTNRSQIRGLLLVAMLCVAACGGDDDASADVDASAASANLVANAQIPLTAANADCIVETFGADRAAKYGNFDSPTAMEGASQKDGEDFFTALATCTATGVGHDTDQQDDEVDDIDEVDGNIIDDEDPEDDFHSDAYITLNANGVDSDEAVASFGDDSEGVIDLVSTYWGAPDSDSGDQPTGIDCTADGATFRRVDWGDRSLLFVDGAFDYWMSTDSDQNVEAFVGDSTTVSILPGFTTVDQLEDQLGSAVEVADEPPLGPSFYISDNFGDLFGEVTDIGPDGIVQSVSSGLGCGE